VHALNRHGDYVTTSSCSGRVALFESPSAGRAAGRWLLVEHRTVTADELILALDNGSVADGSNGAPGPLVTFKLEPPILHVQCRNLDAAQRLLAAATISGFRESGIVLSTSSKVMLGIRTTANTLELPFAQGGSGRAALLVPDAYVTFLAEHAAEKFHANQRRTDALLAAFCGAEAGGVAACVVCEEG